MSQFARSQQYSEYNQPKGLEHSPLSPKKFKKYLLNEWGHLWMSQCVNGSEEMTRILSIPMAYALDWARPEAEDLHIISDLPSVQELIGWVTRCESIGEELWNSWRLKHH